MVRLFLLVIGLIFGTYFYELHTGRSYGVAVTFRDLGDSVVEFIGMAGQGGSATGYGMATSVGQSVGQSARGLANGIESNFRAVGGN